MNRSPLTAAIAEILLQGESFLRAIDDDKYVQNLPSAFNSAVGGHYRHCLDHFQSLLDGLDADEVNYDHRRRDKRTETDRAFALSETQRILKAFRSIPGDFLACPIRVRTKVSYAMEDSSVIGSTVGRELTYAVAHAIHHYAVIAIMCGMLNVPVPAGFGVAPSTIKYHAERPKAA